MTDSQPSSHKKNHKQHQNCDNCVRERKQNEAFIKIYQRLQQVEKNSHRVGQAVQHHKLSSDTNRSFYRSFEQKIISLPKVKRQVNSVALQNAGFQLAVDIIQREAKSKAAQQNQRLKRILGQMRKERWEEQSNPSNPSMASSYFSERKSPQSSGNLDAGCNLYHSSYTTRDFPEPQNPERLKLSGDHSQTTVNSQSCRQNSSTQSSSFSLAPLRGSVDAGKYNDMNLWLYQQEKHAKLEEELFVLRRGKGIRGLPAIRGKK